MASRPTWRPGRSPSGTHARTFSEKQCLATCGAYWTARRAFHHMSDRNIHMSYTVGGFTLSGPCSLDPLFPSPARLPTYAAQRRAGWCRAPARSRPSAHAWPTPSSSVTPSPRSSAPWVRDTKKVPSKSAFSPLPCFITPYFPYAHPLLILDGCRLMDPWCPCLGRCRPAVHHRGAVQRDRLGDEPHPPAALHAQELREARALLHPRHHGHPLHGWCAGPACGRRDLPPRRRLL